MWNLGKLCAKWNQAPSERLRIGERHGDWVAYQFDKAVAYCVDIVEWATSERVNRGSDKEPDWQAKYKLSDILKQEFRLEPPEDDEKPKLSLREIAAAPNSGWKQWRELPVESSEGESQ